MTPSFFLGVVEDTADPLQLGRVRVRCVGYHTPDIKVLPSSALPWALPILPITSASMSGLGTSGTGLLPGSWVWGFFRDGSAAQEPMVAGSMASMSSPVSSGGFTDPSGTYPLNKTAPEPDIPAGATSQYYLAYAYAQKVASLATPIPEAVPPDVSSVAPSEDSQYYERPTWSTPGVADTAPVYPNNKVFRSSSGHTIEIDDTPGKERILVLHKSGTHLEMLPNGRLHTSVRGSAYSVMFADSKIYVSGNASLTVDGDLRTLVKGSAHLEVEGNYTEYIKGSKQVKIGGSEQGEIGFERAYNIGSNDILSTSGYLSVTTGTDCTFTVGGNLAMMVVGSGSFIAGDDLSLTSSDGGFIITGNAASSLGCLGTLTIQGSTIDLNP